MLSKTMPSANDDTMILLCGPGGFTKSCAKICEKLGHKLEDN